MTDEDKGMAWTSYIFLVHGCNGREINGEHQSLIFSCQTIQVFSRLIDELACSWDMQNLDYGVHILLVDLPHVWYLGRQWVQ